MSAISKHVKELARDIHLRPDARGHRDHGIEEINAGPNRLKLRPQNLHQLVRLQT